mgnify:CR=1 FL=1
MRRCVLRGAWIVALWFFLVGRVVAAEFRIDRIDGEYVIDGTLQVPVTVAVAMAVLTDYDRMATFLPDMRESRVLSREGARWLVRQTGTTRLGPFGFDYEVERAVEIDADTVRSRALKGNMRKLEMETHVVATDGGVSIHYRAVLVPDFWVPPLIGPRAMRAQAEKQFEALAAEMKRRQGP